MRKTQNYQVEVVIWIYHQIYSEMYRIQLCNIQTGLRNLTKLAENRMHRRVPLKSKASKV